MKEVVIVGYLRTALTRSRPDDPGRDWFHKWRGDDLLAEVMPQLVKRVGIDPKEIDDFLVGCAAGIGEQWTFGGRTPIFLANFPKEIPAKFMDQQCGSSMACIHMGFLEIATDQADIVMVGGIENMTRVQLLGKGQTVVLNPKLLSSEAYKHWDIYTAMNVGLTAEKLASLNGVSREDIDQWAFRSHQLAAKGQKEGFFKGEILAIKAEQADGSSMVVDKDQSVRADATAEKMAGLKPAFKEGGVITAGNSSPLNAGASSMILMSKATAAKKGIKPIATIRSIGFAGVEPNLMGVGPVPSSRKALRKAGLKVEDIDYWEINEAFSVVPLYCARELGINPDRVNVMGGAVAIGHPLGATGIRLTGTLCRILEAKGGRYGCATACCGGGQGVATIVEREISAK